MGFKKLLSLENDDLLKMLQVGLFFAVYLNKQIRNDKINLWKRNNCTVVHSYFNYCISCWYWPYKNIRLDWEEEREQKKKIAMK